jgi:hypothetical protein
MYQKCTETITQSGGNVPKCTKSITLPGGTCTMYQPFPRKVFAI